MMHAWVAVVLLSAASIGVCANPQLDTSERAEPSFDGLLPLKKTKVRDVWVREGFDLSGYTKLKLGGAVIQYRPVKDAPKTTRSASTQHEFPLSDSAKETLQEIIFEEFQEALEKLERYEIVESSGPDVLTVRGAFLDVVSRVPPERTGRNDYYLSAVGQATFVLELIDSQSEAVLVRAADVRAMESPGYTFRSNPVTNATEARRLFGRWSQIVVDALNTVISMEELSK
jgi:hypothetical protein